MTLSMRIIDWETAGLITRWTPIIMIRQHSSTAKAAVAASSGVTAFYMRETSHLTDGSVRMRQRSRLDVMELKRVFVLVGLLFQASLASAWETDDLNRFLGSLSCTNCDLSGVNFIKADLRAAAASGSDFTGARLYYSVLIGADLARENLNEADLRGANLFYAKLQGASFTGADLKGAILSGSQLQEADLSGANLGGSDLYRADLSGANLALANLGMAFLYEANLTGANLEGARLEGAILCKTMMPDETMDNSGCDMTVGAGRGEGE